MFRTAFLTLAGLLLLGVAARADTLRHSVLDALKEKDTRTSALALEQAVAGQDSKAAAELLVSQVLRKERPETVHEVAVAALSRMASDEAIEVVAAVAREDGLEQRVRAIEVLGRSEAAKAHWALMALSTDPSPVVRTAVASALAWTVRESDRETFVALLDDPAWTVRSVAAGALYQTSGAESVPPLAYGLTRESGRLIDDLTDALESITGERFGPHPHRYLDWWTSKSGKTVAASDWIPPRASFDSPLFATHSRRILFVLSVGETMKQPHGRSRPDKTLLTEVGRAGEDLAKELDEAKTKLDVAKVHLKVMLRTLADGVQFDVLIYSSSPTFAFGDLTAADERSRKRAEGRIQGLSPGTGTNFDGALERVFDQKGKDPFGATGGPDTVVLLTDGSLGRPGREDQLEVSRSVARWNQVRQLRFLVAAVGQADTSFLGGLGGSIPRGELVSIP